MPEGKSRGGSQGTSFSSSSQTAPGRQSCVEGLDEIWSAPHNFGPEAHTEGVMTTLHEQSSRSHVVWGLVETEDTSETGTGTSCSERPNQADRMTRRGAPAGRQRSTSAKLKRRGISAEDVQFSSDADSLGRTSGSSSMGGLAASSAGACTRGGQQSQPPAPLPQQAESARPRQEASDDSDRPLVDAVHEEQQLMNKHMAELAQAFNGSEDTDASSQMLQYRVATTLYYQQQRQDQSQNQQPQQVMLPEGVDWNTLMAQVPRDATGKLTSVGSIPHAIGECKACLFAFSQAGCVNGVACIFCHFAHKRGKPKNKMRPCKGKRDRFRKLLSRLTDQIEDDPESFDVETLELPPSVSGNEAAKCKLIAKLAAQKEQVCATRQSVIEDTTSHREMHPW